MSYDWREKYFNNSLCNGVITNNNNKGNITVKGTLKNGRAGKILYWAANPPDIHDSFSGHGLPYSNPHIAFQNSVNVGSVETNNGEFEISLLYPNSYYVGLGSLYIHPHIYLKYCDSEEITSIKLGEGIPFRTLTHPAPPSRNFRVSSLFYNNQNLPLRSQEQILRDSGYPEYNVVPPKMPDNFWGLKPAL